jgi:hypothetical protein
MIDKLSERDKRFLMVGAAAVIIYVFIQFVFKPFTTSQARLDGNIESKIEFIKKYYEILNQKPYYDAKSGTNKAIAARLGERFLDEKQAGLAAASLQKIIEELARQAGVNIDRARIEKTKPLGGLLAVPVEITIRSDLKSLSQLLHRIENHKKFLVVENLVSYRVNNRVNKPGAENLKSSLLVLGFVRDLSPEAVKKT